jgi:hypothetical protein
MRSTVDLIFNSSTLFRALLISTLRDVTNLAKAITAFYASASLLLVRVTNNSHAVFTAGIVITTGEAFGAFGAFGDLVIFLAFRLGMALLPCLILASINDSVR